MVDMFRLAELKRYPCDLTDDDALAHAIVAVSEMAVQMGARLVEAEINPLFVLPQGQAVRAADGVAVLGG